jgi:hypothetical protein
MTDGRRATEAEIAEIEDAEKALWEQRARPCTHIRPEDIYVFNNNAAVECPCPFCGTWTDPPCGPELGIRVGDGIAIVCYWCGEKYAPRLVEALRVFRDWRESGQDRYDD